ncbi:hypothetical protein ACFVWR_16415 [Leifsonia sp. NPDC058292]|uniref:hypothetical protein n=1 Tax=Leifsonia sp. NPDC058292 TaxID=3346428 RepID=UPI0036DEE487
MRDASAPEPDDLGPVPAAVRAQLLATEHWSLLASRSTTQAEVLTRISLFLTLTSAGLVSLALAGQAMDFGGIFPLLAMIVLAIVLTIGILTQIRVYDVGLEDLAYVLAMNRIRAAYVEIDPGIQPFLMTSAHDDRAGSQLTYQMLARRTGAGHFAGSSMMLISVVNAALAELFLAGVAASLSAPALVPLIVGVVGGASYLVAVLVRSGRRFERVWTFYEPRHATPPD